MAYTWTNKTKTGGVGLTGKIVQKGKDDFPLMYANDLDWANVEVESGVNLNTTDDLLDYIKGSNSTITGRIDELELSNAGYEIRCDKSVCYVGDTLSRVPILVYKNGTLLNWSDILAEGITLKSPITKPSGAIDLILFTSNGQWLAGTANVAGTYVFEFLKNNVVVASFRFVVLMKAYRSTMVTAYKSSSELPSKPQGASYNFNATPATLTMGNDGWATSPTGLSGTIWFCTGYVSEGAPSSIDWNEPCIYLTELIVMQEADHRVKEIAIYKAEKTGTSATTPTGGSYSFSANSGEGSFTCPTGWSLEPNAAVAAYKADSNIASADKDNYKIWKSYNSYQCTVTGDTNLVYGNVTESGWTTPVIYLDIDGILNDADTRAQQTFETALSDAAGDLRDAAQLILNTQPLIDAVNAIFAWRIVDDGDNALDSKYTELVDTNGTDTDMDSLHDLFDGYYSSSNNRYEGTIEGLNSNPNICISSMEFKAIKFGSITDLNSSTADTNKWVAYIPTTTEIRTQIASLSDDLSQLNTTVNQQTPEWIRLQASSGFLKNVTWTVVPESEWDSACAVNPNNGIIVTDLPTEKKDSTHPNGYEFGKYYRISSDGEYTYYRCDYPISTGFANILADRVSFGVATNNLNSGDSVKGALIDMTVDGVSITGRKIVLNGDTVANAIYGKSLNVNNTTYLCADGDAYFGVSNTINPDASNKSGLNTGSGSSRFNHDGSGQLAGGNIQWTGNGSIYLKAAYIGNNNEWAIKSTNTTPAIPIIYSKDSSSNQELYISPQYLKSTAAPTLEVPNPNPDWEILRNGSATFAHGKAVFNAGGSFHIGGASNEVYNVLVTENGQTVTKQEHAGYIDYVPGTGLLTISGDRVNIASNVMALITAGVAGTNEFASIVADAASRSVSINGMLATQDIDVGNGSSYFSTGHDTKTYHGHTYNSATSGAGHLANGNIWWDNVGHLHAKGLMTNRCEYVPGNSNQTVVLDGNNLHSVTLAPTVHRMVVLPTYSDFVDHSSGWTVSGYLQDGTTINIKAEPYDGCSNWSMLKEDSWSALGNYASTADLFKHCILICADPATLCTGAGDNWNLPIHSWKGENPSTSKTVTFENDANVYNNGEWYMPSDDPSYEKKFKYPYRDGRFCARGSYSRFILLLPGQSLTLTSSIQKINVGTDQDPDIKEYLVWNVENAADFLCIRTYMIDEIGGNVENGADFDKNDISMLPYISQSGIGDGLLSYKYMSYDCYAKGDSGRDIERSIFVKINYANSVYDEDNDEMRTVIPSWQTATLQNTRYASYILNTVNVTIPNNLNV